MTQDSVKDRKVRNAAREEFKAAHDTSGLGRPLRRKVLERQLASLSDSQVAVDSHRETGSRDEVYSLPREDRAG